MLSRVKIQNFKSIGEPGVDLELKPLTFLVGPNGGGKSSILEGIGITVQRADGSQLTNFPANYDIMPEGEGLQSLTEMHYSDVGSSGQHLGAKYDLRGETMEPLEGPGSPPQSEFTLTKCRALWSDHQAQTFLLSSERGAVRYDTDTRGQPAWVGRQGEDLLPVLAYVFGPNGDEEAAARITKWADRFGLRSLTPGLSGRERIGAAYHDSELDVRPNLALASSGSRQILAVITQLFHAPTQSLLMIEEPEISLHPKAQIDVLEMFAEAIKGDKQIIATTHSLFMMQGIGYAVHKGWLKPDQVAVYHVEKKKGTGTTSKRLPLSEKGYIKGWVPSFAKVEGQLLREWTKNLPEE
ncbi:MAG: AAA family ATPase [Chloroflexi bacterium]|nr:AAA family ATPase [Chloroflexota bacterium]